VTVPHGACLFFSSFNDFSQLYMTCDVELLMSEKGKDEGS
jgi:hypothetical protein